MEKQMICTSCKKNVANDSGTVVFKCPKCGKTDVIRCKHCRVTAVKYRCKDCDFEGPN